MSEKKMVSRNVAIALGLVCIILSVGLVTVILVSYSHGSESNNSGVFNDPPPLNRVVNSTEDKVNDLESLGCKIVYSTHWYLTFYAHVNYTEFRRMAYNSKVVLCLIVWMDGNFFDSGLSAGTKIFCTMFDGVAIFTL